MDGLFRLTYKLADHPEVEVDDGVHIMSVAFERAILIAETGEAFETTVAPADLHSSYDEFLSNLMGGSVS